MRKRRFAPSPALVVALIALFVALGGTSYATITALPLHSVGTTQLKNNAVTGPKIANGAITAAKISHSALEKATVVGAPGAPAYRNGWFAASAGEEGVSFYKDPWGIVHLQGNAANASPGATVIFTLPPGYRPAGSIYFSVDGAGGTPAVVQITFNGKVSSYLNQTFIGLSNISFRAGL